MNIVALFGAVETGLTYSLVAIGALISFRLLRFPDLSVDGTFALGGAVTAVLIISGVDPYLATAAAILAGCLAGLVTAWLYAFLGFLPLLAGILVMISLYTINIRIMGGPNLPLISSGSIYSPLVDHGVPFYQAYPAIGVVIVMAAKLVVDRFLLSQTGFALRATGTNPALAQAHGIRTRVMFLLGLSAANGLTALAGALFAQSAGSADVSMGVGVVIQGIASLLIGEALLASRRIFVMTGACIFGALLYRLVVALALEADFLHLQAYDLNLITAVLVVLALLLPRFRGQLSRLTSKAAP
jgi:putative tryptophan/tyrosine transport system permease protein